MTNPQPRRALTSRALRGGKDGGDVVNKIYLSMTTKSSYPRFTDVW